VALDFRLAIFGSGFGRRRLFQAKPSLELIVYKQPLVLWEYQQDISSGIRSVNRFDHVG
jgi:hypothetical protein